MTFGTVFLHFWEGFMAAFEKINSGMAGLYQILDYIRLGDNVVWQVTDLSEYRHFVMPFVRQAIRDGRNLIYIRFAQHPPILEEMDGLKIYHFNPDEGFETFTVAIHNVIAQEGYDAFYVFDSLSELQSAWYTDLMMGNFFCVTCPYLFKLDTVAFFPLIRGKHSFEAVARIRETTQLLLDVYSDRDVRYLHPPKVWNRYSTTMFLPHCAKQEGVFEPLTDAVATSRYYSLIQAASAYRQDQSCDSHDRFFSRAKRDFENGTFTDETEDMIIESTMTRDPKMHTLLKQYFEPQDYFAVRDRMIGSGAVGGKACGMLLARKIVEKTLDGYHMHSEQHDSFYIGSDVFYTYIVSNGSWETRIRQKTQEGYLTAADELKQRLLDGTFPNNIREHSGICWNISDRIRLLSGPPACLRMALAMPLQGNTSLCSAQTAENCRNVCRLLKMQFARYMRAPWTRRHWNTEGREGSQRAMSRWRYCTCI